MVLWHISRKKARSIEKVAVDLMIEVHAVDHLKEIQADLMMEVHVENLKCMMQRAINVANHVSFHSDLRAVNQYIVKTVSERMTVSNHEIDLRK